MIHLSWHKIIHHNFTHCQLGTHMNLLKHVIVVVQLLSCCLTLCDTMDCSMPAFPALHYLSEFAQTHVPWVDDAIQTSHPLSSPSPLALNLSQHQGVSNESSHCIRWPKYWTFSFSISPSNVYSGLTSFRIDWFDLLAVQGTFCCPSSLLLHHNSKPSFLWRSAFFMVQLSHP